MTTKFTIKQEPGFYLDRDKAYLPKISGIYIVYKCYYDAFLDTVDVKEVLYIGESENICERHNGTPEQPLKHEHYGDFVKMAGDSSNICYGIVPMEKYSDDERRWIQDAMIYSQKPEINVCEEKEHYSHPTVDITMKGFPDCWNSFHICLSSHK